MVLRMASQGTAAHTGHATGPIIREMRRAQGLGLRELAALADVAPGYLSKVERGLEDPSPRWVKDVTNALGRNLAAKAAS